MSFAIGDYVAHQQLAASENSSVWSGEHSRTGRKVALKIMSVLSAEQIRREAALAGFIEHPHLVSAYDVAVGDEWCALVLQPASGGSLAARLTGGTLTGGQTMTVLAGVAAALAVAHERGLTHGDLSPGNVLLDEQSKPMLADLGAARAAAEINVQVSATPGYVSPEVARGSVPNAASDIFSLGAVALHCLTGKPAWPADNHRDVVIQSTAGQWPDPGTPTGASVRLLRLVRAMLSADPMARPGAAAVLMDLKNAGVPEPLPTTEPADPPYESPSAASAGVGRHACADIDAELAGLELEEREIADSEFAEYGWDEYGWDGRDPAGSELAEAAVPEMTAVPELSVTESEPTYSDPAAPRSGSTGPGFATGSGRSGLRTQLRGGAIRPDADPEPRIGLLHKLAGERTIVRLVALPLAVLLLLSGAVVGGLWWASSSKTEPLALAATGSPADNPVGSSISAAGWPSQGTPTLPLSSEQAAASTTGLSEALSSTEADSKVDWVLVITELDRLRSTAFATRDVLVLHQVYVADSPAMQTDAGRIAGLREKGLRVDGVEHEIQRVTRLDLPGIVIEVTDTMPASTVRDESGAVVGQTAERGSGTRTVELVKAGDGFLIAAVSA